MPDMPDLILKVLTGSRAHGLHTETSDWDYRGVFVTPTSALLRLGQRPAETRWIEGAADMPDKADATAWEVGHFLSLATHCNPTILEVFTAPVVVASMEGEELRALLPAVWHPKGVADAFIGYGLNQRKKMLDGKDRRPRKYAAAYLRALYQGYVLLTEGRLPVDMRDTPIFERLRAWKGGTFTFGEVVDVCAEWEEGVRAAASECAHTPDIGRVNDFLLAVRKANW